MSNYLAFVRPIEKVSVVVDMLTSSTHSCFPVVDTKDRDVLYGTISRHVLCTLLSKRAFGIPIGRRESTNSTVMHSNHVVLEPYGKRYIPLVQLNEVENVRIGFI